MSSRLVAQFRQPTGFLGAVASFVMSHRASNVARSRWTVEQLRLKSAARVLELGCGPGIALEAAARCATEGRVVGLDHSETVLRHARRRNNRAVEGGRVELVLGSYLDLVGSPTLPGPFDAIFAVNSLQFAGTPVELLRALTSRLATGGTLAVTFQSRKRRATHADSRRGGDAVAESFARAGLRDVRVEVLPLEPVCAVCVLGEA